MLRTSFIMSLLLFMALLSGCHKVFQKEYYYVPPHSAADKKCISKCMTARKYCQRICELKNSRSCDCTTSFNTCYSACGGQVIER